MSYLATLTTEDAFVRYEEVRDRLPAAAFPARPVECAGLEAVAEHVDAFVLDSFGVLNVGETPVPGAVERIARLRALGKRLIILTNAASVQLPAALRKYRGLGFDFAEDEVVSSRMVCAARLPALPPGARWGALAAQDDDFADIGADIRPWSAADPAEVDGFLFLSAATFDPATLVALEAALRERPRPLVVANPDIVAPRETGLSKEPGFYAHWLADRTGVRASFFGKPFSGAFDDVRARLPGVAAARTAMVGDTLHTDILGGAAAGMRTVLIRDHGLFAGLPTADFVRRSGITPDFSSATI